MTEQELKQALRKIANRCSNNEDALAQFEAVGLSPAITYDSSGRMFMGMIHHPRTSETVSF